MQFFLGFAGYSSKTPFDPSMMVHFRKRFSEEDLKRINELIAESGRAMVIEAVSPLREDDDSDDPGAHAGTQIEPSRPARKGTEHRCPSRLTPARIGPGATQPEPDAVVPRLLRDGLLLSPLRNPRAGPQAAGPAAGHRGGALRAGGPAGPAAPPVELRLAGALRCWWPISRPRPEEPAVPGTPVGPLAQRSRPCACRVGRWTDHASIRASARARQR
jgi:hypothetical protein